jgi:DNA repair exonuclease SbcCD nuclease subunit
MKFIHVSDLHINSALNTRLSPEKSRERRAELLLSFRALCDRAVSEGAEAVIIAGDLFDTQSPSLSVIDRVLSIIARHPRLKFYYLPGNHERFAILQSGLSLPENLYVFSENWTYFELDGVRIAGRSESCEDMFATLSIDKSRKNIAVLHGTLCEKSREGGFIGEGEVPSGLDYLALGHYHSFSEKRLNENTVAVYSGTLEGRGFDECGECGYVILDISENTKNIRFVPFSKRRLFDVFVDVSRANNQFDIEGLVALSLSEARECDLVRVNLNGYRNAGVSIDVGALRYVFSDKFYYFEIRDVSILKIDFDKYKYDKSLKGELVRLVYADESLSEKEKADIIECGITALMGESARGT